MRLSKKHLKPNGLLTLFNVLTFNFRQKNNLIYEKSDASLELQFLVDFSTFVGHFWSAFGTKIAPK